MNPDIAAPTEADTSALAAQFPPDFLWGVATSSFQIEGSAGMPGVGESIWDHFCRQSGAIADASDGRLACDHVNRLQADLDLIAELGVTAYRFSVAWPRVQPLGVGAWNAAGLDFYERLVDGLLERGIRPCLTLNHWDLPQALQEHGGWGARDTVHRFVDYARGVNRRLGERCALITTHNEPWVIAILGHEQGIFAPGLKSRALAYQVVHHLLLSHGLTLQALRADGCSAELGMVLNLSHVVPASDEPADVARAAQDRTMGLAWYCDPLYFGRYPEAGLAHLGADAPQVQAGDMAAIAQPMDYLGVNNYSRHVARAAAPWDPAEPGGLPVTDMGWEVSPGSLTALLRELQASYGARGDLKLYITENGAAFKDELIAGEVHDAARTRYLFDHIAAVAEARRAGVNVAGYMVWSLMDNFEWAHGYTKRFGIVHVDYTTLQRTPKQSAHWYRRLLAAWRAGAGAPGTV